MKKYLHKFQTEEEFNPEYNGSGYTEPWVSLTNDVIVPSGDVVAFIDSEGYRFERMGVEYYQRYIDPEPEFQGSVWMCTGGTSTISSVTETDGVKKIVVDGVQYRQYSPLYWKRDASQDPMYILWYDPEDAGYVITEYGHDSVGDTVILEKTGDGRDEWFVSAYFEDGSEPEPGYMVFYHEYTNVTKVVRLHELVYEAYVPKPGGRVDYNKKETRFVPVIPPDNQIYYHLIDNPTWWHVDPQTQTGEVIPMPEEVKLGLFSGYTNFSSAWYDPALKLYVAEFSQPVTVFNGYGAMYSDVINGLYLPNTVQNVEIKNYNGFSYLETLVIGSGLTEFTCVDEPLVGTMYIGSMTAPAVTDKSFGGLYYANNILGISTPGNNILYTPEGATGYTGYWESIAFNHELCDFHIETL